MNRRLGMSSIKITACAKLQNVTVRSKHNREVALLVFDRLNLFALESSTKYRRIDSCWTCPISFATSTIDFYLYSHVHG